ncbi:3,4-dihydroxy-2-butanone-4-phosphate synthase [Sphingomonas soli]|uniref:3,4-dihydroxy-2-butanone-4-phosphate synthase n=1 Tax=Sphingomonas soli TaxID=266127 RepID=UPI00082B91E0|nr:3,4-dihydroxy-2-butanone-4-phosphate synthase [Sphingomonas soli]
MTQSDARLVLATPEELVEEARNGRMFILVDDEDRENEGDLVIPAQMATPSAINFMARFGRGLICLALTKARVEQLGLSLMNQDNGSRFETAFTVSIEAREGVTTGISAADRSRTIAVATDHARGADDLVTPGHVFPLIARDGGVLVRAGHTEAAVDIARLAGLNPSGVICEIINDDGTMARMPDLIEFAGHHGLKIGTIRDLIAFRRRHDHLVERLSEVPFESEWGGSWQAINFRNRATGNRHVALVKGHIDPATPTLVRMHVLSANHDLFSGVGGRNGLLHRSMELIGAEGAGVVVVLAGDAAPGIGVSPGDPRVLSPDQSERQFRAYGEGAMILADVGVKDITLLTNWPQMLVGLEGYGLSISGHRAL